MTFGVIFPPLAIVALSTLVCQTLFVQVCLGRLIFLSKSKPKLLKFVEELSAECVGVSALLLKCMSSLAMFVIFVWSWFLLDMLADVLSLKRSIWIFFILPGFRIILLILDMTIKGNNTQFEGGMDRCSSENVSKSTRGDVEMERMSEVKFTYSTYGDEEMNASYSQEVVNPLGHQDNTSETKITQPVNTVCIDHGPDSDDDIRASKNDADNSTNVFAPEKNYYNSD